VAVRSFQSGLAVKHTEDEPLTQALLEAERRARGSQAAAGLRSISPPERVESPKQPAPQPEPPRRPRAAKAPTFQSTRERKPLVDTAPPKPFVRSPKEGSKPRASLDVHTIVSWAAKEPTAPGGSAASGSPQAARRSSGHGAAAGLNGTPRQTGQLPSVHPSQMASPHVFLAAATPRKPGQPSSRSPTKSPDSVQERCRSPPRRPSPACSPSKTTPIVRGDGESGSDCEDDDKSRQPPKLRDGSPTGGTLAMWVGHNVTDFGETTSARVTLQTRVVSPKGSVVQPNSNARISDHTGHDCAHVSFTEQHTKDSTQRRGVKDEWLEEGKAVPLVEPVESQRVAALPRLPRRKQNTNHLPGNGSRAFRSMMKAMREVSREVLHEQKMKHTPQDKRQQQKETGRERDSGGTLRSARACARREVEAGAAAHSRSARDSRVALICSYRSPLATVPSRRGDKNRREAERDREPERGAWKHRSTFKRLLGMRERALNHGERY